jgi:hypothetical protein
MNGNHHKDLEKKKQTLGHYFSVFQNLRVLAVHCFLQREEEHHKE